MDITFQYERGGTAKNHVNCRPKASLGGHCTRTSRDQEEMRVEMTTNQHLQIRTVHNVLHTTHINIMRDVEYLTLSSEMWHTE